MISKCSANTVCTQRQATLPASKWSWGEEWISSSAPLHPSPQRVLGCWASQVRGPSPVRLHRWVGPFPAMLVKHFMMAYGATAHPVSPRTLTKHLSWQRCPGTYFGKYQCSSETGNPSTLSGLRSNLLLQETFPDHPLSVNVPTPSTSATFPTLLIPSF